MDPNIIKLYLVDCEQIEASSKVNNESSFNYQPKEIKQQDMDGLCNYFLLKY